MPMFGIRFIDWNLAKRQGAEKVPYEDWQILEGREYPTFEAAKEDAKYEEQYDMGTVYDETTQNYIRAPRRKYMAFQLPKEADYTVREAARLKAKEYELLPDHMWPDKPNNYYLYPRLCKDDQDKITIGYYDSWREARYDSLKKVKPTKYFSYFFSEDETWDYMAELGLISKDVNLTFVNTREDIRFVYEHGPESCMSGEASQYYSEHQHPCEAYASPDLELAVMYRGDDWKASDAICSRALCNKNTKQWVRIYGDVKRMAKMLEELGYKSNQYCLGGCRLLKIFGKTSEGKERRDILMTPYLDGACTKIVFASDIDEFLTIKPEERVLSGGSTSGYTSI